MKLKSIINSLNLTNGEILILDKAVDRMEFEALPVMALSPDQRVHCPPHCSCLAGWDDWGCDCKGPVGYKDCHPWKTCDELHCRPVQ